MSIRRSATLALVFAALMALPLAAQLRSSVAVVRPSLSQLGKETYLAIAKYFRERRNDELADFFTSYTDGKGFGSGFVLRDPSGRLVVATNRHVVIFADRATLEFDDGEGAVRKIENCPVVFRDDAVDLALILVPEGKGEGLVPLELSSSPPIDGAEVWSAGYPYLLEGPSWQLGKGTVTNRRVVTPKIGLAEFAVFVQHSAPIASGNSGGPLLVGDVADSASLRVVGINTWMVLGRQSSNFAVHLDVLVSSLARAAEADSEALAERTRDHIEAKAREFLSSLNAKEWSRFQADRFISYDLVATQGWSLFTDGLVGMDSALVEEWVDRLLYGSPIETLREMAHYLLYEHLHNDVDPITLVSVDALPSVEGEDVYRVAIRAGRKVYYLDWTFETGSWRIEAAGVPAAGIKGPKGPAAKVTLAKAKGSPGPVTKGSEESKDKSVASMPREGFALPSGLLVAAGTSSLPTQYGWQLGAQVTAGYNLSLGRYLSASGALQVRSGTDLVVNGFQESGYLAGLGASVDAGLVLPARTFTLIPRAGLGASALYRIGGAGDIRLALDPHLSLSFVTESDRAYFFELAPSFAFDGVPFRLQSIGMSLGLLL